MPVPWLPSPHHLDQMRKSYVSMLPDTAPPLSPGGRNGFCKTCFIVESALLLAVLRHLERQLAAPPNQRWQVQATALGLN